MRVSDLTGTETEAIGPAIFAGRGEVYLVNGEVVEYRDFYHSYVPQPERRVTQRRNGDRRRNRKASRRVYARRIRDVMTEREQLALRRGPQWVEMIREEGV
jgi:hypothetical protein